MKFDVFFGILVLCGVLIGCLTVSIVRNEHIKKQLEASKINELAYQRENSSLKEKSIQFENTIEELNHSNDSIVKEMINVKNQLKIKDKEIARLEYLASLVSIKDTIKIKDTIFVKDTKIDTTVNNKWYTIGLHLEYPYMVGLNVSVPSEKYIVSSYSKVVLNPAKCKVRNWFKKKTQIVEIQVFEKNPYIKNDEQKFIEVIK